MSIFDDDRPWQKSSARPGDDLSLLSIEDIEERIAVFRAEIERLEGELRRKRSSMAAADAAFRLPSRGADES